MEAKEQQNTNSASINIIGGLGLVHNAYQLPIVQGSSASRKRASNIYIEYVVSSVIPSTSPLSICSPSSPLYYHKSK